MISLKDSISDLRDTDFKALQDEVDKIEEKMKTANEETMTL